MADRLVDLFKKFIAVVVLCLLTVGLASAQVDSKTYRQFFVIVTADRSTLPGTMIGDTAVPVIPGATGISDRQLASLKSAGLNDADALVAAGILLDFRTQYDQLVTGYDNLPETIAGTNNATPVFLSRMENLVQATEYKLNNSLSVAGMTNLNAYLQETMVSQWQSAPTSLLAASASTNVVIGSCTLTPHYDANMNLTGQLFYPEDKISTNGLVEGYSSASGNCSGVLAYGSFYSHFDGFLCYGQGAGQSPTSWMSVLESGYDFISATTDTSHTVTWSTGVIAIANQVGHLLFSEPTVGVITDYVNWFYEHTASLNGPPYPGCPGPSCHALQKMWCSNEASTLQVSVVYVPDYRIPPRNTPANYYDNYTIGWRAAGTGPWTFFLNSSYALPSITASKLTCIVRP